MNNFEERPRLSTAGCFLLNNWKITVKETETTKYLDRGRMNFIPFNIDHVSLTHEDADTA